MKFLIQTIDGMVVHDFAFAIERAADFYKKMMGTEIAIDYCEGVWFNANYKGYTPIGSVEFVQGFVGTFFPQRIGAVAVPKNVPEELFGCCARDIKNGDKHDITGRSFVKNNGGIKSGVCGNFDPLSSPPIGDGLYQISDVIEIDSEWRAFVFDGEIVGLHNYSGCFYRMPDSWYIKDAIDEYKSAPIAYTLDVAITDKGLTELIEVHDFYSVGLYGFSDYKLIPIMFSRWFYDNITKPV